MKREGRCARGAFTSYTWPFNSTLLIMTNMLSLSLNGKLPCPPTSPLKGTIGAPHLRDRMDML